MCPHKTSTIAKGLKILEIIAQNNVYRGVSFARIVDASKMNRSNVYRYLKTLVDCGWLEFDPETYRYRIGGKPLQIAGASLQQMDLRTIARPFLEELAEETCLAIHLGVMYETSVIYIDKVESNSPIQMRSRPGMSAPAYCTAMGKALLATFDPQEVSVLLAGSFTRRTPNTITTIEELSVDLDRVRERGYAIDHEENELGIGCVGAAIYGYDNNVIGAVSLSTLIQNLTPQNKIVFGKRIMKTASLISQSMGCNHNHWPDEAEHTSNWLREGYAMHEKEVNT
jgi:IclR family KDG regulon transcriptional repressor